MVRPTGLSNFRVTKTTLLLLSFCFCCCGKPEVEKKKEELRDLNVILITIDTLRVDHVGAYEGSRALTPHLDRLAGEGVVFERCIAQAPLTLPSHTTILSGTYPTYHRVRDNGSFVVSEGVQLLSEIAKTRGLVTSAFVGAYVLSSKFGLDQGFDHYSDEFERTKYRTILLNTERRAEKVLADAEDWLRDHKDKQFFSWIHLFDPHSPYAAPSPFDKYPDQP